MKAAVIRDYEATIEVTEVEKPALEDDSVIIEVHSASLNPIDNILRAGYLRQMIELSFPHVMGYDVSGVVVEAGSQVKSLKVGDAVLARPNQQDAGAIAEFARLKESEVAIKPASLSHTNAASIPLAGLTAWQALIARGNLKKGDKVLIHAGSGGVGTLAIQIAKHFGAYVATTTSAKNADLVKRLGADLVIDYKTEKFQERIADYDLVFDMLGGDSIVESFKVLKKGGTLISIKGEDTENLAPQYGVRFENFFMSPDGKMLTALVGLLDTGFIKPVVDKVYPFEQVSDAYDYLATGRAVGKIVIDLK